MSGWSDNSNSDIFDVNGCWPDDLTSILSQDTTLDTNNSELMPEVGNQRSRNWCFTINNPCVNIVKPTNSNLESGQITSENQFLDPTIPWINCAAASLRIKFCVWQSELGSSGTLHIQGYLEFMSPQRFSSTRDLFKGLAHIEPRRGTRHQAIKYCTKNETREDGPWHYYTKEDDKDLQVLMAKAQYGCLSKSDRKAKRFLDAVNNGANDAELQEEFPTFYLRYDQQIARIRLKITKPRNWEMNVIVLQGPKGVGKSKFAAEFSEDLSNIYFKRENKWWCGYSGQQTVVLDDFYGGWIGYSDFLKLLDRYPYLVEAKGKTYQFVSRTIIITTNGLPHKWYKYNFDPIDRRINNYKVWNSDRKVFDEVNNYSEARVLMKDWTKKELFGDN
jgi:hypothetical protein